MAQSRARRLRVVAALEDIEVPGDALVRVVTPRRMVDPHPVFPHCNYLVGEAPGLVARVQALDPPGRLRRNAGRALLLLFPGELPRSPVLWSERAMAEPRVMGSMAFELSADEDGAERDEKPADRAHVEVSGSWLDDEPGCPEAGRFASGTKRLRARTVRGAR